MRAPAQAVKNDVAVSHEKSVQYGGCRVDRKRQEDQLGGERNVTNARKAFATSIDFQMVQLQPAELSLEISCACYLQVNAGVANRGCVAIRIRKGQCTAVCHSCRPVEPAASSCDLFLVSPWETAS